MKHNSESINTFKYITRLIWKEKPLLYVNYFVHFLMKLAELFQNILLPKFIIDEVVLIAKGADVTLHIRNAIVYVAMSLGIYLIRNLIDSATNSIRIYLNEFFNEYTDVQLADKTLSLDFACTEDPESLDRLNRAKEGVSWYSGGVMGMANTYYDIASNILAGFTIISLVIWKCPILLPVQIVGLVLSALINRKNNKMELTFFSKLAKSNRMFCYFFWDICDPNNGKDIRLYDCADLMNKKADRFNDELTGSFRDRMRVNRKYWSLNNVVEFFRTGANYGYIGWKAIAGVFSVGDISLLLSAFSNFYSTIWSIINATQEMHKRSNYFNAYLQFMDYYESNRPDTSLQGTQKVRGQKHVIEFKNVSFKYPRSETYVLKNVSIKIESGEHLSIVGLNGAGKTTFIKLLCRLYKVTEGEILIDGININDYSQEEYIKLFAVVFQDFELFAFSLRENIALAETVSKQENKAFTAQDNKINSILKQVGLYDDVQKLPQKADTAIDKRFEEDGTEFSGGQKQKTAISRALYRNAPIVILDEPTAALDPLAEYEIYRQFNDLVGGRTAVYISHRLSSCKFCDKIAVFSDGTISEYGTHKKLIRCKNGLYAKMFHEQAKYYA